MKTHQLKFVNIVGNLTQLVSACKTNESAHSTSSQPTMEPNTSSPLSQTRPPPCDPYVKYVSNGVPETIHESLVKLASDHKNDFVNIGGCRDTLYFGEYEYRYTGGKHEAKEMPKPVVDLLNHIKPHLSNSATTLNSCLITRYKSGMDHIPPHRDDAPTSDPIIHTGINNIKSRQTCSIQAIGNTLENKCKDIMKVYPTSKIYLSLLLPTKLMSLNHRVKQLNCVLREISNCHKQISIIEHPFSELCDDNDCLREELGRYDREAGVPLAQDALHLGKKGLRLFAVSIKSAFINRYKKRQQGKHGASAVGGAHVSSLPT